MRIRKYMIFKHLQSLQKWVCKYILPCICIGFLYIVLQNLYKCIVIFLFSSIWGRFLEWVCKFPRNDKKRLKTKETRLFGRVSPTNKHNTNYLISSLYKFLSYLLLLLLEQSHKASNYVYCSTPF